MTSQHNTTRIVTEWMCEKKNLNLVRSLSNTYQEYSVTKRKKVDSEGFFQVAFLLSPAFLGEINSGTNLTATVSQVQVKGIHCSSSSSFQWSACLFGAKELDLNAEDSYSFFPTGWTTDKTLIQKVIGMQSILEAKDKIVSCQSSCTAEILGDPILGSTTKRIPVLSIVGKSISLKTDLILKESLATLSHSQDKDNWIRNSQYVVAGILVVEGICLKKVLVEMEFGMSFEWYNQEENVYVSTSTETNTISSENQDDLVVLPSTGLVQKQFLNTLNDLGEEGYAMYQEYETITTITFKNTSPEQKTFDLSLVSFDSIPREIDPNNKEMTLPLDPETVFPQSTIPSTESMTVPRDWYENSIFSQNQTKKGIIIQHSLVRLNQNQFYSFIVNPKRTLLNLSGDGTRIISVNLPEEITINEKMKHYLSISSGESVLESNTPWIFSLGESVTLDPKEGTTLNQLEITTMTSTSFIPISPDSDYNSITQGKETVFEVNKTFSVNLKGNTLKRIYIIPSLLIERNKISQLPRGSTWKMTGMDCELTFSTQYQSEVKVNLGIYPTDSESFDSTSQDNLYLDQRNAPGIWIPFNAQWQWDDSFYASHGFSSIATGIGSISVQKDRNETITVSGLSLAKNLFLIKIPQNQFDPNYDFTVSQTSESLEGLFSIPAQDSDAPFESIAPFVMFFSYTYDEMATMIKLNCTMNIKTSLVRIS